MNKNAEINAKKYLLILNTLYPEITEEFKNIEESGKQLDNIKYVTFSEKIKKLITSLKQIDISALREIAKDDVIKGIENDINFMYEELLYIQKRLLAIKYADALKVPIKRYLKNVTGDPSNYKRWAQHPDELAKKFIEMLVHPNNIETYKGQIKRIILGTMTLKQFQKLFDMSKYKMIASPENTFQSFKDYKGDEPSRSIQYKP